MRSLVKQKDSRSYIRISSYRASFCIFLTRIPLTKSRAFQIARSYTRNKKNVFIENIMRAHSSQNPSILFIRRAQLDQGYILYKRNVIKNQPSAHICARTYCEKSRFNCVAHFESCQNTRVVFDEK